jgi:hypothetical protein
MLIAATTTCNFVHTALYVWGYRRRQSLAFLFGRRQLSLTMNFFDLLFRFRRQKLQATNTIMMLAFDPDVEIIFSKISLC